MADNPSTAAPAAPKKRARPSRRGKTLTPAEKAEAIALWRVGDTTLDELAAKFDRHRTTFIRLFNEEGVMKGEAREEHERKVTAAVETAALGDAAVIAQRIRETKEEHYKMASGMSKLAWTLIAKCRQENKAVSTIINDLKSLKYGTEIIKAMREERFAILGLNEKERNDDTPMPDLVLQELTADQIKEMTNARVEEDDLGIAQGSPEISDMDDGSLQ